MAKKILKIQTMKKRQNSKFWLTYWRAMQLSSCCLSWVQSYVAKIQHISSIPPPRFCLVTQCSSPFPSLSWGVVLCDVTKTVAWETSLQYITGLTYKMAIFRKNALHQGLWSHVNFTLGVGKVFRGLSEQRWAVCMYTPLYSNSK